MARRIDAGDRVFVRGGDRFAHELPKHVTDWLFLQADGAPIDMEADVMSRCVDFYAGPRLLLSIPYESMYSGAHIELPALEGVYSRPPQKELQQAEIPLPEEEPGSSDKKPPRRLVRFRNK